MYIKSAQVYDRIYQQMGKDYAAEIEKVRALLAIHQKSRGRDLLDVACGTGQHLLHLRNYFQVEGLDLVPAMLEEARLRMPDIIFHQADMAEFDLGRQYDVVTCLFSAIGYLKTIPRMRQAIAVMARHVAPGGVLMVEPWLAPGQWQPGSVRAIFVDDPDLKIARMNTGGVRDNISFFDLHFQVGTPQGIDYFVEHHELALFTVDEYMEAFQLAGLDVTYDPDGLDKRGLYLGVKPVL